MKWQVEITTPALKHLLKINDVRVRKKLFERIEQLEDDPESQGKPLKDELAGLRSIRAIGQRYRIIYRVVNAEVIVFVIAVGIRRQGDQSDIYEIAVRLMRSGLMTL